MLVVDSDAYFLSLCRLELHVISFHFQPVYRVQLPLVSPYFR